MQYICSVCGISFCRSPSHMRKSKQPYCSLKCFSNRMGGRVVVSCSICGKEVVRAASHAKRNANQLCSSRCRDVLYKRTNTNDGSSLWRGGKVQTQCEECGNPLERFPYELKARTFCNRSCFTAWKSKNFAGEKNPHWRGGYKEDYYGPNWRTQSRAARQRDQHCCQRCGITQKELKRTLHVHHIIPFRSFGYRRGENDKYLAANRLDNLISLCARCHNSAEIRRH